MLERVPEFSFIRKIAEELDVKIYLFGGSAAAYAHYVRWDIERQAGKSFFQEERFDYDFTNIYRGNQDLDVVVDGKIEQAELVKQALMESYPHFIGDKEAWEVRLLRDTVGDKLPLLNDKEFQNQHTDSNSIGMLDLTAESDDKVFRDLLDWENSRPLFLKDVASAQITYLFNKNHEKTSRFKEGKNPPIFSAVRYLAKLTQYEVKGIRGDLEKIKSIITKTDFKELTPYVKHKLEEFAKKTLLNSPDSEYAWNLLEGVGLRRKLIEMDKNKIDEPETLSWWMNKEPLRSKKFGIEGQTAEEIYGSKEIIVAHETNSFLAYDNITRSTRGRANAFISRDGVEGEAAVHGDGFYVKLGTEGAVGSGLTIRFILHPKAREGTDFSIWNNFLIVQNKNALSLIQENINLDIVDFLKLLKENEIDENDKGLLEKFRRKFSRIPTDSDEFQRAVDFVKNQFFISKDFPASGQFDLNKYDLNDFSVLIDLMTDELQPFYKKKVLKVLKEQSDELLENQYWIERILQNDQLKKEIIQNVLHLKGWEKREDILLSLIDEGEFDSLILRQILSKKHWENADVSLDKIVAKEKFDKEIVEHVLSKKQWVRRDDLIETFLKKENIDEEIVRYVLSQKHWSHRSDWVKRLIIKDELREQIANSILSEPYWSDHPEFVQYYFDKDEVDYSFVTGVLSRKHWRPYKKWFDKVAEEKRFDLDLMYILSEKESLPYADILEKLILRGDVDRQIAEEVFSKSYWSEYPKLLKLLIKNKKAGAEIAQHVLSKKEWSIYPKLVLQLIKQKEFNSDVARYTLSQPHWINHPELVISLIRTEGAAWPISSFVLSRKHWADHPIIIEEWIKVAVKEDKRLVEDVLSHPHWRKHKDLKEYLGGKKVTLKNWKKQTVPFSKWWASRKKNFQCSAFL